MTAAPLLEVRGLVTRFFTGAGTVRAVDGVSFSLAPGEAVGLVGESGCGKSVSALSIMRLVPSPPGRTVAGQVLFGGRELLTLSEPELRRVRGGEIAMIFQDPMTSLNPVLPVGLQIVEALEFQRGMERAAARRRAVELLDLVGIPAAHRRIDDYPHQFSGGMRQRVMIAIAISCQPKLLIADEPTTALDVTIQAQILDLIRRLRRELGMALILITHDLGVVAGICDRVNVMYAGRIVETASVDAAFGDPRHPYTLGLLNSVPRLDRPLSAHLVPIEGLPPDLIGEMAGCPFAPRCTYRIDRCLAEPPPLTTVPDGGDGGHRHGAACWVDTRQRVLSAEC
ncbi:MAG TPA: ABC transporter ATP-binding protein [Chloroflexota bacterium]|nr:ABC transporter ATP-binding protein [Chloroflexota bacterium]